MKTSKIVFVALGFLMYGFSTAQTAGSGLDDFDRISIAAYVSDQVEYLPAGAGSNLQSKLGQMITASGFGNSTYNTRFILTPNVQVVSKNIVASAPPRVAMKLNVHLFVGDGVEGTKFGSTMITVNGVGSNENKAYIAALEQIKAGDPAVNRLISSAKQRILDYYNSQCGFILREAETAATQNNLDEALYILTGIPKVNMDCYERAMDLIAPVYQQKINRDCTVNLSAARNAWNAGQDYQAAVEAMGLLQKIEPDAECFGNVQRLSTEIGRRMREIDTREWNYELREQDLERRKVDAAREIGVAYGNNQPQNMTYNLRGWW